MHETPDAITERSVAAALQQALLPTGLPEIDGWAVATLYEPAGEAVLVGGDFYDWFTLPNGNVLFFLGDVSGKGPLAGALGMSIRKALKGISWVVEDSFAVLPVLERALAEEFRDSFATLCLIEITPGSGHLRLLLAGHPAPWLRDALGFRQVDAPVNGLLGPGLHTRWRSVTMQLGSGDMLVLFTDGLTDARLPDGRLFGEGPLEQFLQSLPPLLSSYETILQADAHLRRVADALADDVIIAVLAYRPAPPIQRSRASRGQVLSVELPPQSTSAALGRAFVRDVCHSWKIPEDVVFAVESIASELVANGVLHARTDLELRLSREDNRLRVAVRDNAPQLPRLPPTGSAPDPGALYEHGRGLDLIRLLGARIGVDTEAHGKVVWASLSV